MIKLLNTKTLVALMRILLIIAVFGWFGCQQSKKQSMIYPDTKSDPCQNIPEEIDTTFIFGSSDLNSHWKDFDSTVKFLESKGPLKQTIIKDQVKIDNWKDFYLRVTIDTCNHRLVTKNFILKNITATRCLFRSKIALKNTKNDFPGFLFSQLNFAGNTDRDNALKIIKWVYKYGGTLYEYKYNQTILRNKTIYFIEPNAKIFEKTAILYAKYISDYIEREKS